MHELREVTDKEWKATIPPHRWAKENDNRLYVSDTCDLCPDHIVPKFKPIEESDFYRPSGSNLAIAKVVKA